MSEPPPKFFDPERIVQVLGSYGVRYVLVGGLAATLHGSPALTYDLDLAPDLARENLERLAAALVELGAVRYTDREGPVADPSPAGLIEDVEQFASPIGYIDVLRWIPVSGGFEQLAARADSIDVGGVVVLVASLDDVIASKQAAGRPKDLAQLPALYALRDELRRGEGSR